MRLPLLFLACLLAFPAGAQPPPVPLLDVAGFPGIRPADHASLRRFLTTNVPRVLAVGPNGAIGWQSQGGDPAAVERRAIQSCQQKADGAACQVFIRDLDILWPGRTWAAPTPPAGIEIGDWNHETLPDPRFLWWGPQAAAGVLVWGHGRAARGADSRGQQPQSWVRHFNNAGFDIWRFDRHPNADDTDRAATWLRADLADLRRRGYRRVVMAGQSRGAWNSLQMTETAGLADAAIAIAPAAHGETGSTGHLRQLDDLRGIVGRAAAPRIRLAIANFRDDPFDAEGDARGALFRQLGARAAAFLFIDRPEGLSGHGAGATLGFGDRFGACLLRFATAATPPTAC